jgi:chemotaxis protein methyltransferase CheR
MTQEEFDYLRDMLKARSGLVLGDEKRYLLESRLMPVAREIGLESLSGLVSNLKTDDGDELREKVTQAMTINESFFFATNRRLKISKTSWRRPCSHLREPPAAT